MSEKLREIAIINSRQNVRLVLQAGQVFRIGPRYNGSNAYADDNGTGEVVRLLRQLPLSADWYVSADLDHEPDPLQAKWTRVVHESRLRDSSLLAAPYYSVVVPWSECPTKWHPTDRDGPFSSLTRGAFAFECQAHAWAKDHLQGQPYHVRVYYDAPPQPGLFEGKPA